MTFFKSQRKRLRRVRAAFAASGRAQLFSVSVLLLSGIATSGYAVSPGGPYEVFGLHSDDMLVMRAAPDVLSGVVGWIAYDAVDVDLLAVSQDGVWGKVRRDGVDGWVAVRHLRPPGGGH